MSVRSRLQGPKRSYSLMVERRPYTPDSARLARGEGSIPSRSTKQSFKGLFKMFIYGFELEGFNKSEDNTLLLPDKSWSTDGFNGLCEVKSTEPSDIRTAYFSCFAEYTKYNFTLTTKETFTPTQKQELRKRTSIQKQPAVISNIYEHKPKALNNSTLASFQINISKRIQRAYIDTKNNIHYPAIYSIFDFPLIIKRLDNEFKKEIKESQRQPGCYSIKDNCRLEYRSLPNNIFETDPHKIKILLTRITNTVEQI